LNTQFHLPRVTPEFIPKPHGHGILQVRAPGSSLRRQTRRSSGRDFGKLFQGRDQSLLNQGGGGDVNYRRDYIVTGLTEVYMIVGMDRLFSALFRLAFHLPGPR